MPKRVKRVIHSKEEVAAAMKKNVDFQRKMAFIKEKFWPALCEAASSVEDAGHLLTGWNNQIMQEYLAGMKEKKAIDLRLEDKLSKDSPKYLQYLELVRLFNDLSLFEVKEYIEGMREEIQLFLREENEKRSLKDLHTRWADEITKP